VEHTIRRIRENVVYRNGFAALYDDPVVFPDGTEGSYLRIVESDGDPGVAVLAVCADRVALVLTYRYPVSALEWGVPRGFAHGGDPAATARDELTEELGREPDSLIPIGAVTPNSGLLASRVEVFLAHYATPASVPQDTREVAAVRWIAMSDLAGEIASGAIQDAFTLSAVTCALARRLIEFP
jgi:8-oxo-dGTP pyrophosphatase MutT (NUDIX family)